MALAVNGRSLEPNMESTRVIIGTARLRSTLVLGIECMGVHCCDKFHEALGQTPRVLCTRDMFGPAQEPKQHVETGTRSTSPP